MSFHGTIKVYFKIKVGAGEIAQWLRGLAALSEDLSLVASISTGQQLTTTGNAGSRRLNTFLWPPWALMYVWRSLSVSLSLCLTHTNVK